MNPSIGLYTLGQKPIIPIADLEGSKKYSHEEIEFRNKLASLYRLVDMFQWSQGIYNHISYRLPSKSGHEEILINPLGILYREVTASTLVKITVDGKVLDPGSTGLGINQAGYILHSAIHEARPDIKCVLHLHTASGAAVSTMKCGLLPLTQESMLIGPVSYHEFEGMLSLEEEKRSIAHAVSDKNKKVVMLRNHGFVVCSDSIEEALHLAYHTIIAIETQVRAIPFGISNLVLPPEKYIKKTYELAVHGTNGMNRVSAENGNNGTMVHTLEKQGNIEWGVGELEWEAYMRHLDQIGYKTGYKYRLPLLKESIYRNVK